MCLGTRQRVLNCFLVTIDIFYRMPITESRKLKKKRVLTTPVKTLFKITIY
jgi:hypothetical protein